jgi:hypothetical protein
MKKKTKIILILIIILVGTLIAVSAFTNKSFESELTPETYSEYDQYGLNYQEEEAFEYLVEIMPLDEFEIIGAYEDNLEYYTCHNVDIKENVSSLLDAGNTINEVLLTRSKEVDQILNYMIDYDTESGDRVILTYTYTGYVSKIIASRFTIIEVNNELKKQTRYKIKN